MGRGSFSTWQIQADSREFLTQSTGVPGARYRNDNERISVSCASRCKPCSIKLLEFEGKASQVLYSAWRAPGSVAWPEAFSMATGSRPINSREDENSQNQKNAVTAAIGAAPRDDEAGTLEAGRPGTRLIQ